MKFRTTHQPNRFGPLRSGLCAAAAALLLAPGLSWAATININMADGPLAIDATGETYSRDDGATNTPFVAADDNFVITGSAPNNNHNITVTGIKPINITLNNAKVDMPGGAGGPCAFSVGNAINKTTVNLTLAAGSDNTLTSKNTCAGLYVPTDSTLVIDGTGKLTASGGDSGGAGIGGSRGIGGSQGGSGGSITIHGGTVTATGHAGGAGIGGGLNGTGGSITIDGTANVTATATVFGAGIGSGYNELQAPLDEGTITIDLRSGAVVNATGGSVLDANIGGGSYYNGLGNASGSGVTSYTDPTDQSVASGATATFGCNATLKKSPLIAFTGWTKADGNLPSPVFADLPLSAINTWNVIASAANDGWLYSCTIKVLSITYYSAPAKLTVTGAAPVNAAAPTIGTQPVTANYAQNAAATALTVAATSPDGGNLSYQWFSNAADSNTTGTAIAGATAASYTPPTATLGTVYYYCEVTNTNAAATGNKTAKLPTNTAKVTVTSATAVSAEAPTFSTQPQGKSYPNYQPGDVLDTLTAAVTAPSDGGTVTWQWLRNGVAITGATGASYTPTEAGTYIAVATNSGGTGATPTSTNSSPAVITLGALSAAGLSSVPTLNQWALTLLAMLMTGVAVLRRRA
jgi:hypothetical protein